MGSRILITTGDPDGIGPEIVGRAIQRIGPARGIQFIVLRSKNRLDGFAFPKGFKKATHKSLNEALASPDQSHTLLVVESEDSPAKWVEQAAHACLHKRADALVTAPLSKTTIREAGLDDIGHTEILSRICDVRSLYMGFIGHSFSVLLATGHMPTQLALRGMKTIEWTKVFAAASQLRSLLPAISRKRPLALVGVNPHASEQGLIGGDDLWLAEQIKASNLGPKDLRGPLVPDSAFLPQEWTRTSVYVCCYHDQGLIPFKLVHGFDHGVHLTFGLPFIRTSPDHGTAKNLFGTKKAKFGSMQESIQMAIQLIGKNKKGRK